MKKGELKLVVDKTQMFTARFTKTSALKPVFARAVNSAYSNIYISALFRQMEVNHINFKKNGNMLEVLDWDLNFSALRHLKHLR